MDSEREAAGVYARDADGVERLVHLYQGGEYGLADIVDNWALGRVLPSERADETVVELSRRELDQLKVMADAYGFDFEEAFIEMCHEMHRFSLTLRGETIRFTATF